MKVQKEDDILFNDILRSFYLHASVVGGLFLLTWGVKQLNIDIPLLANKTKIDVIQSAVRVDIVAMPKMTLKELETLTPSGEEGKEEKAPPETKAPPPDEKTDEAFLKEKKQQSFSDMLKEMSKKKLEAKKKPETLKGLKGDLKQLLLAGNKISKGSSTTGVSQEQLGVFAAYTSRLPDHVRRYWRLPGYLSQQDLKCRIRVYISSNGDLIKAQIYETSGNEEYDRLALNAVRAASPFPEVDGEIRQQVLSGSILLGFPL